MLCTLILQGDLRFSGAKFRCYTKNNISLFVNSIAGKKKKVVKYRLFSKSLPLAVNFFCSDQNKQRVAHETLQQSADTSDLVETEKCQTIQQATECALY